MQVHQTPTLLLTRPRAASERFAEGLQGATVVIAPLMEIVATGESVSLDRVQGVILTSEAAVAFLPPARLPAYCVGPRTATAAQAVGLAAEVCGPDAEGLVNALRNRHLKGHLVHVHGTHTRGDIAGRLTSDGLVVTGIAAYDQRATKPLPTFHKALAQPALVVPLFSPRSAGLFAEAAVQLRSDTQILALSQAVAEALPSSMQDQTHVIAHPTGAEMLRVMERYGVQRNSP
ncbi:uroporphyrinogen-III synthase [Gymnodinialimonas sp. 57CJ19]|uniref:uroporphyrinogen-III synthase n=1 Tax=Gymnodinialimonas sp. 57CJ19 TaxID=3138498 RepID=UPI0031342793